MTIATRKSEHFELSQGVMLTIVREGQSPHPDDEAFVVLPVDEVDAARLDAELAVLELALMDGDECDPEPTDDGRMQVWCYSTLAAV